MPQPRPRNESQLSEPVNRRLHMYTLAAGAAGVGLLASAPPSEARIVYTHVHKAIRPNYHFDIDLNHDAIVDFTIQNVYRSNTFYKVASLRAHPAQSANAVEGKLTNHGASQPWVFALRPGARISPAKPFSGSLMAADSLSNFSGAKGFWWSKRSRVVGYLGLRFQVHGKTHYGWARLRVVNHYPDVEKLDVTLLGYAYETVPNKPIIAGQTKGSDDADNSVGQPNPTSQTMPTPEPATLGALAIGAPGLSIWRRKETSLDGQ